MKDNNDVFSFTYSSKQQEEIKRIRAKYTEPIEDKMEQLRSLDKSVTKKATAISIILGIIGELIMGAGMSLVMTDIGTVLGIKNAVLPGIIIGIIGIVPVALAYSVYLHIVKKERKKIAPEIIRLTDELMK